MPINVDTTGFAMGGYANQQNKNRSLQVDEAQQNLAEQKSQFEQANIQKKQYLDQVANQVQGLQNYMSTAVDPAHIAYGKQVAEKLKQAYGGAQARQLGVDNYVNQMIDLAVRMPNNVDSAKVTGMSKAAEIKSTASSLGVDPSRFVPGYTTSQTTGGQSPAMPPQQSLPPDNSNPNAAGAPIAPAIDADQIIPTLDNNVLKEVPDILRGQVKAIAHGDQPFPTPYALAKSPQAQQIMAYVYKYNPNANANMFKSAQAFNTGTQGNQVRSFGVGISHLNTLSNLVDALDNGDVKAVNKAANSVKDQMGYAAPTNFDTAKQIVGNEIVKAITGAHGGQDDRDKAQAVIDNAKSTTQLKGAINTYKSLMHGQLLGLQNQYEVSTGRKDFINRLPKEAQAELNSNQIQTFSSPNDKGFAELPPGTKFIDAASGQQMVKH